MGEFKKRTFKISELLKIITITTILLFMQSVKTFADEYWYSDELDAIKKIPKPEEALNSTINIKDGFNVPGMRQEFAVSDANNWKMYYDGNSTYKVTDQQNMAIMYNDTWIGQKGMMWYNRTVNLNYSFEVESYFLVQANRLRGQSTEYGFKGASSGIAFVLQNDPSGPNAIGGRGGGMGVYPAAANTSNMIYNALAVEFDTSDNFSTKTNGANHDIKLDRNASTPHMAVGSTYVGGTFVSHGEDTTKVMTNFKHDAFMTPGTGITLGNYQSILNPNEGDSWYNQWVKVTTRWEPVLDAGIEEGDSANIKYGKMSYQLGPITNQKTGQVYTYPLKTSEAIDIDEMFNARSKTPNWDRNVYWGYTGGGQPAKDGTIALDYTYWQDLRTDNITSPGAVMVTKLPFEADIDVKRQVKNITTGETNYKEKTTAHVGDIVEYKVDVANKVMDQSDLPFAKFRLQEDLQTNNYVANSFKFTSAAHAGPVARIDTTGGENLFKVGYDSYSPKDIDPLYDPEKHPDTTLIDAEVAKYTYKTGTSFSYTYQVKIGADTQTFDNKLNIKSAYTTESDYGDTSVIVYPKNQKMTKSLPNKTNPIVDENVDVQLDLSIEEGVLKLKNIIDSVPSGFEIQPNSTKLSLLDKDSGIVDTLNLNDSSVWSGLDLTINNSSVPTLNNFLLQGGTTNRRTLRISYTIFPKEDIQGQIVELPKSSASGSSINDGVNTVYDYDFTDTTTNNVKVKTDYTILFKTKDGDMDPSWVISSNAEFNNKNKVILYYNTNDSYDIQATINEISSHIEDNQGIYLRQQTGDPLAGVIKEKGNTTTLVYQPKDVLLSFKQVYKEDNTKPIYKDLENEIPVDNSDNVYDAEIGDPLQEVIDNLISKHQADFKLDYDGYTTITSNQYKVFVNNVEVAKDVVPETDFEVRFEYTGFVAFETRPDIDFGKAKLDSGSQQTYSPVNAETEVKIMNTTLTESWELYLSLPDGFEGDSGEDYLGEIFYVDDSEKKSVIGKSSIMIEQQTAAGLIQSIDMKGKSSKKGLLINQQIGNRAEKFKGKLLWSLEDTPID